jgi:hypothetical protein
MSFNTKYQSTQPDGEAPPHGIGAPAPLTPSESLAEFLALRKQFVDEFQPRGVVEQTMVYQLTTIAWRLRRLPFLESVLTGVLFRRGAAWKELDLLSRHETRLNRAFAQTLREIELRHKASPLKPVRAAAARSSAASGENKSESAPGFNLQRGSAHDGAPRSFGATGLTPVFPAPVRQK